jgi:signal transduction histidine kinase
MAERMTIFGMTRLLRLDEDKVLVEQLKVLLHNYSTAALPLAALIVLIYWALANDANAAAFQVWAALAMPSTLGFYFFALYYLRAGIPFEKARRLAWICLVARFLDGAIWGSLVWVALETSSETGNILVFASIASMAGGAVSTLSPVLPVFIAYIIPLLVGMSLKLWLTGDPGYEAVAWAGMLYLLAMMSQAVNTLRAIRSTIDLRFELTESNRQLREIEHREAMAKERKRLMQDMHDGLGSSLVSALHAVKHGRMDEAAVAEVLAGCIDDLKLTIDSMEPVDADLLLLLATLRYRLGARLESSGIKFNWEVRPVPAMDWLNQRNALHILRILQESITNIVKHAQATTIGVSTYAEGDHVIVSICDDGQGFRVEEALARGGKGLTNQMSRAESLGASVNWQSGGTGTCFTLRLPIFRT